jgi:predicted nucleic acid-binding Zn ribbon protein
LLVKPYFATPRSRPPRRSARAQVLAAWRGVDTAPLEIARADSGRPVGKLVSRALQGLGLDQRRAEAEILKVWNHLIDASLTAHAQPAGIRKGTLFVNVDSSVWLDEIVRYRRKEILDRMQNAFGREMIQRISFRIG